MRLKSIARAVLMAFTPLNQSSTKAGPIFVPEADFYYGKSPTKAKFKQNQRKQRKVSARKKSRKI